MSLIRAQLGDIGKREKTRKKKVRESRVRGRRKRWRQKIIKPTKRKGITEYPYGKRRYKVPKGRRQ